MDIEVFHIRPGDTDLAARVQRGYDMLYAEMPRDVEFDLAGAGTSFYPKSGEHRFVAYGDKRFAGYAECTEKGPADDVGQISQLEGCSNPNHQMWSRTSGLIAQESLREQPGYDRYTSKGRVLNIGTIETVYVGVTPRRDPGRRERVGIGRAIIEKIMALGPELIEAEAVGRSVGFFEKMGFENTGIKSGDTNPPRTVMVWNNPAYTT